MREIQSLSTKAKTTSDCLGVPYRAEPNTVTSPSPSGAFCSLLLEYAIQAELTNTTTA